jgi:hypothetical protein
MLSIWLPIALAQNYFRYNAYILPVCGLALALLCTLLILTGKTVSEKIHAFHQGFGTRKPLEYFLVIAGIGGLLLLVLGGGEWYVIRKSAEHVAELKKSDSRVTQNLRPEVPTNPSVPDSHSSSPPQSDNHRAPVTTKDGVKKNRLLGAVKTEPEKGNKEAAPSTPPNTTRPGSISQSNSGGINVQQGTTGNDSPIINSPITVGNVPKSISPQDMSALTSYFSNAKNKAKVNVAADQISGAAPFPGDFYDALKAGGWIMLEQGVNQYIGFAAPGKRFQGAIVTVRGEPLGPNETVSFEGSDPITYIGAALEAFKIPRSLKRDKSQEEGVITVDFQGGFPHN